MNYKKFTLIELLVVLAIIGLLMSMLLPSLKKARSIAKQSVCVSNLKQQGMAVEMYVSSNNGILPPHLTTPPPPYVPPYRPHRLAVYLNGTLENSKEIFQCPAVKVHHGLGDYADNHAHIFPNTMPASTGRFLDKYSRPAELMSHIDSGFQSMPLKGTWWAPCPVTDPTNDVQVSGRHEEKTSVLFLDSHVEILKRNRVYNNNNDLWGHYSR